LRAASPPGVVRIRSLDVIPWLIPLLPDDRATLREIYDRLDGLFLTGGVDVDPSKYGEVKEPYCGRTDVARDDVEIQMIRWSLEDKKLRSGEWRFLTENEVLEFQAEFAKKKAPKSTYTDITWTGYVGEEVPERYTKIFNVVRDGRDAARRHARARAQAHRNRFQSGRLDGV
jgi:hypothetical protein